MTKTDATEAEILRMLPNKENRVAWAVASGLAGWMQLCCGKLVGGHIREDSARMILCEILQAQPLSFWVRINKVPDGWNDRTQHVDVCLGEPSGGNVSSYGVIELKWPWTVPAKKRATVRRQIAEDVARLVAVETRNAPHIRYLVFGCMRQAYGPLFSKKHPEATPENQRQVFRRLLSMDLQQPTCKVKRTYVMAAFRDFEKRIPKRARLGKEGFVETRLEALQHVMIGPVHLGSVFVWQCNHVDSGAT